LEPRVHGIAGERDGLKSFAWLTMTGQPQLGKNFAALGWDCKTSS